MLRKLLTPGALPESNVGLVLEGELPEVEWMLRLHARSVVRYQAHLVVARAAEVQGAPPQGVPRPLPA